MDIQTHRRLAVHTVFSYVIGPHTALAITAVVVAIWRHVGVLVVYLRLYRRPGIVWGPTLLGVCLRLGLEEA